MDTLGVIFIRIMGDSGRKVSAIDLNNFMQVWGQLRVTLGVIGFASRFPPTHFED